MNNPSDFGRRLKFAREKAHLTQSELALRVSGVSPSYLSRLEAGTRRPSTEVTEALATALGLTVGTLSGADFGQVSESSDVTDVLLAALTAGGIVESSVEFRRHVHAHLVPEGVSDTPVGWRTLVVRCWLHLMGSRVSAAHEAIAQAVEQCPRKDIRVVLTACRETIAELSENPRRAALIGMTYMADLFILDAPSPILLPWLVNTALKQALSTYGDFEGFAEKWSQLADRQLVDFILDGELAAMIAAAGHGGVEFSGLTQTDSDIGIVHALHVTGIGILSRPGDDPVSAPDIEAMASLEEAARPFVSTTIRKRMLVALVRALIHVGDHERAHEVLTTAVAQDARLLTPITAALLARTSIGLGRWDEATTHLESVYSGSCA
ncbi:hypothetical protein KEM60_01050 [Austwickia sp. TVS 96-490-7B]|uniref:helix-turn-helix domain-containing protein n=1 Tax=Austwickia sp. TVS 96-490-7B TaxID=2830843 RepID=UPI001C583A6E|nr:helix-turn-helix transcriptional regulator [Austwickia sp. TVS 96-490-7B]MBW3084861.1 hypothetical protein [Austwickia sp. TVS 96-490-7B]